MRIVPGVGACSDRNRKNEGKGGNRDPARAPGALSGLTGDRNNFDRCYRLGYGNCDVLLRNVMYVGFKECVQLILCGIMSIRFMA